MSKPLTVGGLIAKLNEFPVDAYVRTEGAYYNGNAVDVQLDGVAGWIDAEYDEMEEGRQIVLITR